MADTTDTRRAAWDKTYNAYLNLNQRLSEAQTPDRDALERAVAAQQDALLELPAPSLAAVIVKLEMMWDCHLDGLDQEAEERRLVLEDLHDLSSELTSPIGIRH